MTLAEQGDGEMVRAIRSWVYREMMLSKRLSLSKTQFKRAIRIAMLEYVKIAVEEADKYNAVKAVEQEPVNQV